MNSIKQTTIIRTEKSTKLTHFVYLPEGYEDYPQKKWPGILFLHGRDERGKDFEVLPDGGLHAFVEKNALPFIILEPQCPGDSEWVLQLDTLRSYMKEMIELYNVDTRQFYLTGLSMGAIGAWHLGINYPELFAAIIPVSGGTYPYIGYPEAVERLKDVPVWAFHGKDDDVLPIALTQVLVNTLLHTIRNCMILDFSS